MGNCLSIRTPITSIRNESEVITLDPTNIRRKNKKKWAHMDLIFLFLLSFPRKASLEGILLSEISHRSFFMMTALNPCQIIRRLWHLGVGIYWFVFFHLVWALPCSWCDERFLKLNPGHMGPSVRNCCCRCFVSKSCPNLLRPYGP